MLLIAAGAGAQAPAPAKAPPRKAAAVATTVRPPRVVVQRAALANGLRILMVEDHSAPVVNLQVWYHVGSKDERPGRTGFAHLFEHMMFKGSTNVPPETHSRIVEAAGGFDNAYTNDDVTVYWQTFPSSYLERMLWLEADRMGGLKIDESNFKSEREVVKEERRTGVDNPPYGKVIEDLYDAAFDVHPYKHTTIGSMADLDNARIEDVIAFHRTYYRPDNATLVIVGDFAPAQAVAWTRQFFGGIPRPAQPVPRVTAQEPPQAAEKRLTKWYGNNSPLPGVIAGYRVPAVCTPDSYALNLASNILSTGESSRLYRQLVYEEQLAMQTAGFGNFTEHPNLFWAFAIMNPGKSAGQGEKAIDAQLEKMKNTPVSKQELEKAKNQVISQLILSRQTVQQKADALGGRAVLCGDPALINIELDRYLAVTAADIQRVARKYFVPAQRTVLVIEPPKESK
jgi:zinc protease